MYGTLTFCLYESKRGKKLPASVGIYVTNYVPLTGLGIGRPDASPIGVCSPVPSRPVVEMPGRLTPLITLACQEVSVHKLSLVLGFCRCELRPPNFAIV